MMVLSYSSAFSPDYRNSSVTDSHCFSTTVLCSVVALCSSDDNFFVVVPPGYATICTRYKAV